MGQAQINVNTRACSRTFIARTKQAALTQHVRGEKLIHRLWLKNQRGSDSLCCRSRIYTCGVGSDGIAALLSACSLVRCCSHQFVFPCLEVLFHGTPPLCAVSCKTLQGHSVDAKAPSFTITTHMSVWFS